jgi:cytolysin (calcineurin-like family phosphatase)
MRYVLAALLIVAQAAAEVTFLATSDTQYVAAKDDERNARNQSAIREMNAITERRWPAKFGAEPVARPRGVVVLGDLVEHAGRAGEWDRFAAEFGLDGTDGALKYPVFEGWGNHDGPVEQAQIKKRNEVRLQKKLIQHVSENGLHYSWDWDNVHFAHLNRYPGHQSSLDFLKTDLAANVGRSGRPVVLLHHYDLQNFKWWKREEVAAYREAVKPYNVLLICHGHTGLGVYTWNNCDVINTGQTENGFFAVQITDKHLRFAWRARHEDGWRWHLMQETKRRGASWWEAVSVLLQPLRPPC